MDVATLNLTSGRAQRRLLYRKGASDEAVLVQALKNSGYNSGRLRRSAELPGLDERLAGPALHS